MTLLIINLKNNRLENQEIFRLTSYKQLIDALTMDYLQFIKVMTYVNKNILKIKNHCDELESIQKLYKNVIK